MIISSIPSPQKALTSTKTTTREVVGIMIWVLEIPQPYNSLHTEHLQIWAYYVAVEKHSAPPPDPTMLQFQNSVSEGDLRDYPALGLSL